MRALLETCNGKVLLAWVGTVPRLATFIGHRHRGNPAMFDSRMLIVILVLALIIFGTTRLRSVGTDVGAAVKGFRQAMRDSDAAVQASPPERTSGQDFSGTPP
jgi:sec-independent protein translocase protein TatA